MYTHILYLFTRPIQIQTLFWFSIHIRIYICVALVPLVSVYIISLILSVYSFLVYILRVHKPVFSSGKQGQATLPELDRI
jgi:hypothetical protein